MSMQTRITLSIPARADMVSLARLTTSGVASQMGADIDAIEDLKVCVSEVLSKIVDSPFGKGEIPIVMNFLPSETALEIHIGGENLRGNTLFASESDQFALAILNTLMEETDFSGCDMKAVRLVKSVEGVDADD